MEIRTGKQGSGKSMFAVEEALNDCICRDGILCSNIELRWDNVIKYCETENGYHPHEDQYIFLDNKMIREPYKYAPQGSENSPTMILLDEAVTYFNSRNWKDRTNDFIDALSMERRTNRKFVFLCLSASLIDKQLRLTPQKIINHINLKRAFQVPFLGKYPYEHFIINTYDSSGTTKLTMQFRTMPKVKDCYYTKQVFKQFDGPPTPNIKGYKINKKDWLKKWLFSF